VPGDPYEGDTRQDAFVMSRDGSNPTNLTSEVGDGYFSGFTWTFDGRWVLFREGLDTTPDRVLAADLQGHAVEVTGLLPVVMACSPDDSTLVYVGTETECHLPAAGLTWSGDTVHVSGAGSVLSQATFDRYLDWVKYSGR